ncbi:thioredoxin-like protein [Blastocladiella britannica]|nr:thioredoxin-like protein [Blastocladiella britannica]
MASSRIIGTRCLFSFGCATILQLKSASAYHTTSARARTTRIASSFLASYKMASTMTAPDFYSLSALDAKKNQVNFADFKGKVVLIVNVASKCGFTGQYDGLEKLYATYKDQGLVILGFPCNQFAGQEPGSEEEITSFCRLTYGVSFPIMAKVDTNGENESPVYAWLKSQKSGILGLTRIKWNFEKFLVSHDGQVLDRWASTTKPEDLTKAIEAALKSAQA